MPRSALVLCLALGFGHGLVACQAHTGTKKPAAGSDASRLEAVPVSDDKFAVAVHRLLREGKPTPERSALLAGAVRRQLRHANALFARGEEARGTNAVVGALYLTRVGEGRPDMFDAKSTAALRGAVEKFSARGDEGRALALMLMLRPLLSKPSSERAQLEQHISALERWMRDTRTGGDMARLAAEERATVARALLETSPESLEAAAVAISKWIDRAVEYNLEYHRTRKRPPREEAHEAFRALQSGGATMAALYLRHGDAKKALARIEGTAARRVISTEFFGALRAAAVDDTASDWRMLARVFSRADFDSELEDLQLEGALLDAAMWGVALESYRRDPTSLAVAHLLADHLVTLEMPEVAPLVLRDALGEQPSLVALSSALGVVAEAIAGQFDSNTLDTARRVFDAAAPIVVLADQDRYRGKTKPSPTEVRQLMAGIELRSGHVDHARPLLVDALEAEPTVWGYTMLGTLERQAGKPKDALRYATRANTLPAARVLMLDALDAKLLAFEVLRDGGAKQEARKALEEALAIALASRKRQTPPATQVRNEQLLARVLDGYGDRSKASRALQRALEIASRHQPLLGRAVLGAVGRALVYRDLSAARAAMQLGIKSEADPEDLAYGALWLMLLERELGEAPDGKVDRVLVDVVQRDDWIADLARWARGKLSDKALRGAASTYSEKVEAEFYIAMLARASGKAKGNGKLREVANNPLIDLMEVQLARDILAPRLKAPLPSKYRIPD
jgi:tetratricopeptide (TPR) repeat protein